MSFKTRKLVEQAVMIALAVVLNLVVLWQMPAGGKVTLFSMLPIMLISVKYGLKSGFFAAFVYSLLQTAFSFGKILGWGLSTEVFIACILLDYIIPYTGLCLAGLFTGKDKSTEFSAYAGFTLAVAFRFLCHFVSGIVLWGTWEEGTAKVVLFSLTYNGTYLLPELGLTIFAAVILMRVPVIKSLVLTKE